MKQRLDLVLVERGLAPTRAVAQAMIMAGEISHETTVLMKPGQTVATDIALQVAERPRYVSRGGDKLASVVAALKLDFTGAIVLDVGSSTGGFSDYALQHGAAHIFAVDVGTGQLAYALRQDPRVTSMERTDIRVVKPEQLEPRPTIAVIDVSFISLTKILPAVASLIQPGPPIVAMAKPQFESDKPTTDRYHGVIRDEKVRQRILQSLQTEIKKSFTIAGFADSAVHGPSGNRERFYLLHARSGSKR
jgi:23S rRNA (cytidine1920-2'-O)/16S rRNA (cytidine1409-2'-O)-methyltransferase